MSKITTATTIALLALPVTSPAAQGKWGFSKDGGTLVCQGNGEKHPVSIPHISTRNSFDIPPLNKSRRAFISPDSTAAAIFDLDNGKTMYRFFRGCILIGSSTVAGMEIFGTVYVHPEYGSTGAYVNAISGDALRDEHPLRTGELIYHGLGGPARTVAKIDDAVALYTNYELTKNKRYAKIDILGTIYFIDFKTGTSYAHRPTSASRFRGATLTDTGKVTIRYLKKLTRPDGTLMTEKEFEELYRQIGFKAYEQRRELVEVTDEHQL